MGAHWAAAPTGRPLSAAPTGLPSSVATTGLPSAATSIGLPLMWAASSNVVTSFGAEARSKRPPPAEARSKRLPSTACFYAGTQRGAHRATIVGALAEVIFAGNADSCQDVFVRWFGYVLSGCRKKRRGDPTGNLAGQPCGATPPRRVRSLVCHLRRPDQPTSIQMRQK